MNLPVQVPDLTRLRLAHGCLQHLAHRAGVEVLHLKGVALHPALADGRRPSTDCDVLVRPGGAESFCLVLVEHGWEQITSFADGSVFGHAAAFHHPVWGTVDVHRTFPGLDQSPERSFARLWSTRGSIRLGGVDCTVPDLLGQRLVLLVHAARDASGRRRHDVRVGWEGLEVAERRRLDSLAEDLGATVPLALATGRPELARGRGAEHLWTALHANADPISIWRARLRDARTLRQQATLLRSALRVNHDHLALRLGRPPTPQEVRREWWARWWRVGRRTLPSLHCLRRR